MTSDPPPAGSPEGLLLGEDDLRRLAEVHPTEMRDGVDVDDLLTIRVMLARTALDLLRRLADTQARATAAEGEAADLARLREAVRAESGGSALFCSLDPEDVRVVLRARGWVRRPHEGVQEVWERPTTSTRWKGATDLVYVAVTVGSPVPFSLLADVAEVDDVPRVEVLAELLAARDARRASPSASSLCTNAGAAAQRIAP